MRARSGSAPNDTLRIRFRPRERTWTRCRYRRDLHWERDKYAGMGISAGAGVTQSREAPAARPDGKQLIRVGEHPQAGVHVRTRVQLDAVDFGRNPRGPEFGEFGVCYIRHGKAQRGSPPKRRSVLTVWKWSVDVQQVKRKVDYRWHLRDLIRRIHHDHNVELVNRLVALLILHFAQPVPDRASPSTTTSSTTGKACCASATRPSLSRRPSTKCSSTTKPHHRHQPGQPVVVPRPSCRPAHPPGSLSWRTLWPSGTM